MDTVANQKIALEKRLNEIRRLEYLKDNLLAALEELAPPDWLLNDPMSLKYRRARTAIESAKASRPA